MISEKITEILIKRRDELVYRLFSARRNKKLEIPYSLFFNYCSKQIEYIISELEAINEYLENLPIDDKYHDSTRW